MGRLARVFLLLALAACPAVAQSRGAHVATPKPVQHVGPARLAIGGGMLPLYLSQDWTVPQPAVTRAVVIVHGLNRNADDYFATIQKAQALAGADARTTLIVAPQFLAAEDVAAQSLPPDMLRWDWNGWSDGSNAEGPAPVSSFAALDAVVQHIADRRLFPGLTQVVVAGFSAGGQMVQRYAAVGHAPAGPEVRFVVGSPSSYVYFSADRPAPVVACPGFNNWRFGLAGGLPPYVGTAPDAAALERAYAARDITYLIGGADTDPNQRVLDRSCGAEAQGPSRLARGMAFTDYLRARDPPATRQPRWVIPGVGHNERAILTSACGVAALFGTPNCTQ